MVVKWLKRLGLGIVAAAVIAAAYVALKPLPVPVDVARISTGPMEVTVDEDGVARIREVYKVSAPITGKLERLVLEVGDLVEKDSRIAVVRPVDPPIRDARTMRELEAALRAAQAGVGLGEAEVTRAEAALKFAQAELSRQQELSRSRISSDRALQQAELDLDTRKAQVRQAQANLDLRIREREAAEARLLQPDAAERQENAIRCCIDITAPASGSVLKLYTESEQVVQAGAALLEIGDKSDIEIVVDLLSADAVSVGAGFDAWIERWGGEGRLKAKVRRIDPVGFTKVSALGVEEQRVNTTLDITDPRETWARLGHDYRVFVRIVVWRGDAVLRVPLGALFRKGTEWAVFQVVDGVAVERIVSIGRRNAHHAQVLEGLAKDDTVILYPSDRVSGGTEVEVRAEES